MDGISVPGQGNDDRQLDRAFVALADPVRRQLVARLSRGSATVNELAEPFTISKQGVSKHIRVLEDAGLVTRSRRGQSRPCHLNPARLEELTAWIDGYRLRAEAAFRQLDAVLAVPPSPLPSTEPQGTRSGHTAASLPEAPTPVTPRSKERDND